MKHHAVNMGCRNSKKKFNKEGEKQKICKIGVNFGRNDLKVEGNFQAGYHTKSDKKYSTVDGILPVIEEGVGEGVGEGIGEENEN